MNHKLFFGVTIPAIIVIVLIFLSGSNSGLIIEANFVDSINENELFSNDTRGKTLQIGEINIENNYFFPRKIDLSNYKICGEYNDDRYSRYSEVAFYISESSYKQYGTIDEQIELSPNQKKELIIALPLDLKPYTTYSKILIIKSNENKDYRSCYNLENSEIIKTINILE